MKWCLIVHGTGFSLRIDDDPPRACGFHQVHWIAASSVAKAAEIAFKRIRSDRHLQDLVGRTDLSTLSLSIDESREVEDFEDVESNPTGYNFYPCEADQGN